jgi:hypothetical protein
MCRHSLFLFAVFVTLTPLHSAELYFTDFEDFPVGDNAWAGTENWLSNDTSSGVQSIDQDLIPGAGLGKTASLGFKQPQQDFVFTARTFDYDHVATGVPVVGITSLLGIEDSSNGFRDDFYLSIYNSQGDRLASIRFDNEDPNAPGSNFGIWREDGVSQFDTNINFIRGELLELFLEIDIAANTWSASRDGIPLFTEAPFTATTSEINFGFIAFEWDLTSSTLSEHGNNFLLIADLAVFTLPEGTSPFHASLSQNENGDSVITWPGDPGFNYQVEASTNLIDWSADLPSSYFTNIRTEQTLHYTDSSVSKNGNRFYRINRAESQ